MPSPGNVLRVFLALVVLFQQASADDDCKKVFKLLPESYSASMQISVRSVDSDSTDLVLELEEFLDLESSPAAKIVQTQVVPQGSQSVILRNNYIFNRELEGVKLFLRHEEVGIPPVKALCSADDLDEDNLLNFLFGFTNEQHPFPTITGMLHFHSDENWKCFNDTIYKKGLPVITFKGTSDDGDGTKVNTIYYWTLDDQELSIPVAAELEIIETKDGQEHFRTAYIDFSSFIASTPSRDLFFPPRDIHCIDREPTVKLKNNLPSYFTMETETILYSDKTGLYPHVQTEYHDVRFQASRADYKRFIPKNSTKREFTTVSSIKDWFTGVEYITDKVTGECKIDQITHELLEELIIIVEDQGHVHMPSAMQYFMLDHEMSFNGDFIERGILTSFYETQLKVVSNWTYVLGLASEKVNMAGTGYDGIVPVSVRMYSNENYLNKKKSFRQNIVNFANGFKGETFNYVFDVTQCFPSLFKFHFRIRFPLTEDMSLENKKELVDELRDHISYAAGITSIRVQNLVIDNSFTDLYVIGTLIDFPFWVESVDPSKLIPEATYPLELAEESLRNKVTTGKLAISVPNIDSRKPDVIVVADKNVFEKVDRWDDPKNHNVTITKTTLGWSSGSMAALGICMLIISTAGFIALFKFVLAW